MGVIRNISGWAVVAAMAWPTLGAAQNARLDPGLELQRERDLNQRRREVEDFVPRAGPVDPGPAQARGGPCFHVSQITVSGVTVLPAKELQTILTRYVPGCLEGADIQAVMRSIDRAYAERGYITTKTYIPPQNIASGVLQLSVLEGVTEGVYLVDQDGLNETGRAKRQLATAFPGVKKRVFQLRDYEQGLDQMNRLASVEARLRLQPGQVPGGSNVIVQRIQDDQFRGYLTFDNQGSEATGVNRLRFDLQYDDLIGVNDAWRLGFVGTRNTNALDFGVTVPAGYWTFGLSGSYSEYLTRLTAVSELFGRSVNADLTANRILRRDQTSLTSLDLGLNFHRSERFINDAELTPQNLRVLSAGVKHIVTNGKTTQSFDASVRVGLNAMGATRDRGGLSDRIPHAQFLKLEGGLYQQAPIGNIGVLTTDIRLQYSPTALFSAEQMALGSYSTVRGYEISNAIGDSGFYVRNDLFLDPGLFGGGGEAKAGFWQDLQHQFFVDAGMTYDNAQQRRQRAASIGYGLSWQKGRVYAEAMLAVPLIENTRLDLGDPLVWVRLNIKSF